MKIWTDKRRRYTCLLVLFVLLVIPTETIWRSSILWTNTMSILALILGAVASLEASTPD